MLLTLSNHVPFPQVTVHFYEQGRSVKKWFRIVIVGVRVTWICARNVCIISTVLFLELCETLAVISLLDVPLKSRAGSSPACISSTLPDLHRISISCCYFRDLSRGLLLEGPALRLRLVGILYEVANERIYVDTTSFL